MARACEALVFSKCKDDIFEKATVYQIGGQTGHSPEEHIFTLKSLIGLMYSMGEGLILNLVDIISFFDREDIVDVVEAMEDMGVNQKAIRLWYKLNEKTEIAIKTSVGRSKKTLLGALVGQGSGGAAVGSQAMVDMGMKKYLESSEDEMYYGDVRVESAIYQDDIAKPSQDVRTAQSGMTRLAAMLNERGLEAHRDKTSYLVCGSEAFKKKTEESLMLTPLVFGDFTVKRKISDKYLGQIIHEGGLKESVRGTIKERTGKIKGAIYLTKSVIETYQMQEIGGMMAARTLWEGAIVPSLLHGAGTWVGSDKDTDLMCEELQLLFWRTIFQVPRSTPKVMLRADTKSMQIKQRIWKQKLLLARSIMRKEKSLAREVYQQQI